ncbi:MAG: DUF4292 domain-containing protein [Mucilaginibacter sp.]
MKRNILNKLLIAACLLVMVSCKARKLAVVTPPPVATTPVATTKPVNPIDAIKAVQLNFNTFSAKADGTLDIDGDKNDVTLNVRIARDKKIWLSVSKNVLIADVELARVLITPDSIFLIDKWHKEYLKKPFTFVQTYGGKQVSYKTLEALLLGIALPEILNDKNANLQNNSGIITISGNLEYVAYKTLFGADKRVAQLSLSNPAEQQSLQVTNKEFTQSGNKIIPSQIDIQSAIKSKKIQVNLQYTRVDFDQQLDYPFSIPESYKPAD